MDGKIRIHGHRGCKGYWPENTLKGFKEAILLGVHSIELDVVLSADQEIVIAHDPFIDHRLALNPDGSQIVEGYANDNNIYGMHYPEIAKYRIGELKSVGFDQQNIWPSHIPTLNDLVTMTKEFQSWLTSNSYPYNIEVKSHQEWDEVYHPRPQKYAEIVLKEIYRLNIQHQCIIQSFDARLLKALHSIDQTIRLVFLSDHCPDVQKCLDEFQFIPFAFSIQHDSIRQEFSDACKSNGSRLFAWTVNNLEQGRKLMYLGVTDIITDYPKLFINSFDMSDL